MQVKCSCSCAVSKFWILGPQHALQYTIQTQWLKPITNVPTIMSTSIDEAVTAAAKA